MSINPFPLDIVVNALAFKLATAANEHSTCSLALAVATYGLAYQAGTTPPSAASDTSGGLWAEMANLGLVCLIVGDDSDIGCTPAWTELAAKVFPLIGFTQQLSKEKPAAKVTTLKTVPKDTPPT